MSIRFRSSTFAVLLFGIVAMVTGCSSSSKQVKDEAPVRTLPEGLALRDVQKSAYGATEASHPASSDVIVVATDALAARGLKIPHSPALDDFAAVVATTLAEEGAYPANTLLQWTAWQAGVTGSVDYLGGDHGAGGVGDRVLDEGLTTRVNEIDATEIGRRQFGVARVLSKGHVGQAIIVVEDLCAITNANKTSTAGASYSFSGACFVGLDDVTAFIDGEGAEIRRVPITIDDDGTFEATVEVPPDAGAHFLEITAIFADDRGANRWRRSVAMFPIYVDVAEPTEPDDVIRQPKENPADLAQWETEFLEGLNAARKHVGAPAITPDPRMTTLASEIVAKDTAEVQAHISLQNELAARGLAVRDGRVIAGATEYLDEEMWILFRSPAMRAFLLDPAMTKIGVAYGVETGRLRRHRVLMATPVGVIDRAHETSAFASALTKPRKKRGAPPIIVDDKLSAVVQAHADRVCRGEGTIDETVQLQQEFNALRRESKSAPVLRTWRGVYVDPHAPEIRNDLGKVDGTHVGIGVCQGTVEGKTNQELAVFLFIDAPTSSSTNN